MSILWTSDDAAAATGGQVTKAWQATGISIDTRSLETGDLFVALKDVRDGHDFVAQALEKGAAAALVSRVPEGVAPDAPLLIVPDVLKALEDMAVAARTRTSAKVIGVTGSVGKTSTKEMLRVVLARQGRTFAAEKSFNNHWGVPLTLARMPADTEFAVIEIGMNHPGEIAPLARLARPHVAMITNVAVVHMEAFGGIEDIAREKASIFEGVEPNGHAVVNGDLETTDILLARADALGLDCTTFGEGEKNNYRLSSARLGQTSPPYMIARAELAGEKVYFGVYGAGSGFTLNALGVLAVINALGLDLALVVSDLMLWRPELGRGSVEKVVLDAVERDQKLTLIDDAFNASPVSLDNSLSTLMEIAPADGLGLREKGRHIVILGDMLELGGDEVALHADFATHPAFDKIDQVHCVGLLMRHLWLALPAFKRGEWVSTAQELASIAHRLVDAGDVILVKGSKGSRVSLVVDAIRKLDKNNNNKGSE